MRMTVATAVACLLGVGISTAQDAQASVKKETTIPAQGLRPALKQLANDRDIQLVYRSELVGERQTTGAVGELTFDEALTKLLAGTGLTYQYLDDRAVTIVPMSSFSAQAADRSAQVLPSGVWGRFRLAQVDASSSSNASSSQKEAQPGELGLEEIVVTAQKREERLQDVPISISVLSGADLDRSTADGASELLNRVPGVIANTGNSFGGSSITIRGVSSGTFNGASPVAYYLDGVPFGFVKFGLVPDTNVYDLERIEVLRGPQGTLYGASAQSGVVRILTADPDVNRFDFKARTSVSSTEAGGEGYRGDLAINVPIIDGKLAARAVVGYQDLSGWIDSPEGKEINDGEVGNYRLKVKAQPTENLSVGLSAWRSKSDYGSTNRSADGERRLSPAPLERDFSTEYDVYGLKIGYDFPLFSITSTTGYLDYENSGNQDLSLTGSPGTGILSAFYSKVRSQEVVLNSTHTKAWRWTFGAMYRDVDARLFQLFSPPEPVPIDFGDTSESLAVFGELTRVFFDGRFEVTGGLRYFEDDVAQLELQRYLNDGQPLYRADNTFEKVSPRVALTWHPSADLTAYVAYSEGFRSGFDQHAIVKAFAPDFPPVQEDNLKNYEVGVKGALWANRVNFEAAVYYVDWEDVQQTVTLNVAGGQFTALGNGKSASGVGYDVGLTAQPVDRLTLGLNFSHNDLTQDSDVLIGGRPLFSRGDRLNTSPENTLGASVDYVFLPGNRGWQAQLSASANYISEQDSRGFFNGVSTNFPGDDMLIARTSVALSAGDHWSATLFVDNVNNERGAVTRSALNIPDQALRIRPRTVGLQLEYHY